MIIRCRCILENEEGKIFVVKQRPEYNFFSLPGGKLDEDESTLECISRELYEELGMKIIPTLRVVHELISIDSLEFIFYAKISESMLQIEHASHAFELHGTEFVDTLTTGKIIYPEFISDESFLEWLHTESGLRYILN
ncbi:MAG: NUDIX hydrolase [Candidatus Gracilibacteria bacterium]